MEKFLKGKYRIDEKVGESPFSITYKGSLIEEEKPLIIKIFKRALLNSFLIKEVKKKVKLLRDITHPNIAKIYDGDYGWQGFYFVREYVEGKNLTQVLEIKEPMEISKALKIATSISEALVLPHRQGVIHGALKPNNVFISAGNIVKVVDFIVHGAIKTGATQCAEMVLKDAKYLTPEEIKGEEIRKESDIYMIGLLLYEMLTSKHPFENGNLKVAIDHLKGDFFPPSKLNPNVPDYIDKIIIQAMNKDPLLRFEDAQHLLESFKTKSVIGRTDIETFQDTSLKIVVENSKLPEQKTEQKVKRRKFIFVIIFLIILAAIFGVLYSVFSIFFK